MVRPAFADGVFNAQNFALDGRQAEVSQRPILVMFNADHCPYCWQVKRDYIESLSSHPNYSKQLIIRIVNTDSDIAIVDFNGIKGTHASFAIEQGITLVPTVRFFDVNGQPLTSDLVGAGLSDFYLFYLESAISKARENLGRSRVFRD